MSQSAGTQMAFRVPLDLHKAVKVHCVATDQTIASFVTRALERALEVEKGSLVDMPEEGNA